MTSAEGAARVRDDAGSEEAWTILRMILWSADYLAEKGVDNSRLDAEWLLADALEVERLQLYLQYDRAVDPRGAGGVQTVVASPGRPGAATVHSRDERHLGNWIW